MRAFTEWSLGADPTRSLDARVANYRILFAEHGAMSPVGTERATATEAAVRVKSKKGEFTLVLSLSPTDPSRAASIRFEGRQ